MGQLREKMIEDMQLRGLRPNTQAAYLRCVKQLARHFMRSPASLGAGEVREFVLHLVQVRRVAPSTQNVYVGAIRFLYQISLGRPEVAKQIPRCKVRRTLPDVLSGTEVDRLLQACGLKHRALLMLAYGAGLRISEARSLLVEDIDSRRCLIRVRDGKGGKDRYVMLSHRLLETLRIYYRAERPTGPYLFTGAKADRPITAEAIRRAMRSAKEKAQIKRRVTPHSLRHAFATHLIEVGASTHVVQILLGHRSPRSTEHYLHVSAAYISKVTSPLDLLGTKDAKVLG